MSKQKTHQRVVITWRFLMLLGAAVGTAWMLWVLRDVEARGTVSHTVAMIASLVAAFCTGFLLFYRYSIAPSLSRYYVFSAFFVYITSGVLFLGASFFLGEAFKTELASVQAWSFYIPRLLFAVLLLSAARASLVVDGSEQLKQGKRTGLFFLLAFIVAGGFFAIARVIAVPATFTIDPVLSAAEVLPTLLLVGVMMLVLLRGKWREDNFDYGMLWMSLAFTVSSVSLMFAATGSMLSIVGLFLHLVGLVIPFLVIQVEMFDLYRASEEHRSHSRSMRFGSQAVTEKQKLVAEVFQQAVDQSDDSLYIMDSKGQVVFANQGFLTMSAREAKDVLYETPDSWTHKTEGQTTYAEILSDLRTRKKSFSDTMWHRRKDGTPYEASVHISPIVDEFGKVTWFIAREQDLTETRERTLLMQQILDNMPLGVCLVEAPSTKVVLSNHYADSLLHKAGFKDIEEFRNIFSGLSLEGKPYPEARIPLAETLESKEEAEKDDIELQCEKREGEVKCGVIWKMHTNPLFDAEATLRHVLVVFDDITSQKELEHKMTDAISVVSHQLRTPINGIKWAVDELRQSGQFDSEGDTKELFDSLYDATVRMFNVVQGLLDVSKIEQGKIEMHEESIVLNELIDDVIKELSPPAREKHLVVKKSVVSTIPGASYDPILIRQVIQNLLDNAIRYTPEGGEIDSILSVEKDALHWMLHDTGIGIPKEEMEHLFEKFHRGDNAQRVDAYGMGIGLYAIKSILDLIGGEVRCESEEGKGTTFHVYFPLKGASKA